MLNDAESNLIFHPVDPENIITIISEHQLNTSIFPEKPEKFSIESLKSILFSQILKI